MRLELTGRHVRITPTLHRLVDERLQKLDRVMNDRAMSMQVVLSLERFRHKAEMTLHTRGEHFFHGTGSGENWEIALNQGLEKIDKQVRKLKGKWEDGKRRGVSAAKAAAAAPRPERGGGVGPDGEARRKSTGGAGARPGKEARVIRSRSRAAKPMTIEDAAAQLGDGNDCVIVFRNSTTDAMTVLFRRPDGNLGLIEPEA